MSYLGYDSDFQPIYHCRLCEDSGFLRGSEGHAIFCAGNGQCGIGHCGKMGATHYTHTYTRPCFCRATNPVLAHYREQLRERQGKGPTKAEQARA